MLIANIYELMETKSPRRLAVTRLMMLPGRTAPFSTVQDAAINAGSFEATTQKRQADIQRGISERNARLFEAAAGKLDGWADDLKLGLEREIEELDRQIKEARRSATTALTLEDKLAGQKQIRAIEVQRNQKRQTLFDAQDQVDKRREELIALIEGKLQQRTSDRKSVHNSLEPSLTLGEMPGSVTTEHRMKPLQCI